MKTLLTLFISCSLILLSSRWEEARAQNPDIIPKSQSQISLSFAPIVKQVSPAVVNIFTKRVVTQTANPFSNDPFFSQFFGHELGLGVPRQRLENSLGSGVIVNEKGLVVTNAHVVRNADEVKVTLSDGRDFDAKIALLDQASDIALLRIEGENEKFPYASFQPSETMEVGDLVIAIGNPFGVGQTVTSGIVSALARSAMNISDFNFFIQTDAAINPGNSGGPLVSMSGGIVGINSAIYSRDGGSLGIGFAIPSEMVAAIIAAEETGQVGKNGVKRPWFGITVQDITSDLAASLNLPRPTGAIVSNLHPDSPMREAGVEVGDIITEINHRPIRDGAEMRFRLVMVPLNDTATIEYMRKGEKKSGTMKMIAPPERPSRSPLTLTGNQPLAGATIMNINPAVSVELGLGEETGVVISKLPPNRQLSSILRPGEIIDSINGKSMRNVNEVKDALEKNDGRGWNFIFSYNGQKRQIVVR